MIGAHGDKCYGYRNIWEKAGIPFEKGVAIYLLSYVYPYSQTVRQTSVGWVAPDKWVIYQWNNGWSELFLERHYNEST